jgi:hypothetical protein
MEALKSYLFTAMLASLASTILIRITDPRHRSYLRYIAGLALLLLISSPLTSLGAELGAALSDVEFSGSDKTEDDKKEFLGEMGRTMSVQIGDLIAKEFSLSRERVTVKLTLDLSDVSAIAIYRVDVSISGNCDADAIDRYLTESLNCEVTVIAVP